jgi:preprotein translocase subunit Sec63
MNKKKLFNSFTQFALPIFTIGGQVLTSLKFPQYGLIFGLMAQPFWLYSTWKAYRQAEQIGVFINTVIFTIITALGVINYWR